jgi:hypothetical protein
MTGDKKRAPFSAAASVVPIGMAKVWRRMKRR